MALHVHASMLPLVRVCAQVTAAYEYYTMDWLSRNLREALKPVPRSQSFSSIDRRS